MPPPGRRSKSLLLQGSLADKRNSRNGGTQHASSGAPGPSPQDARPTDADGGKPQPEGGSVEAGGSTLIPQVLLARMGFGDGDRERERPEAPGSTSPAESWSRQRAACGTRSGDSSVRGASSSRGSSEGARQGCGSAEGGAHASLSPRVTPQASLRSRKAQESDQAAAGRARPEGRNYKPADHTEDFGGLRAFCNYILEEISDHHSLLHSHIDATPPLGVAASRFELPKLLAVPIKLEKTIVVGFLVCADAFLYNFTLLPIRSLFGLGEPPRSASPAVCIAPGTETEAQGAGGLRGGFEEVTERARARETDREEGLTGRMLWGRRAAHALSSTFGALKRTVNGQPLSARKHASRGSGAGGSSGGGVGGSPRAAHQHDLSPAPEPGGKVTLHPRNSAFGRVIRCVRAFW